MKYICPACAWTGEPEKPFPCPACGIGDKEFPLIELKDNLLVTGNATDPEPRLRCLDCGVVHSFGAWLDNAENCPNCDSHNATTERATIQ